MDCKPPGRVALAVSAFVVAVCSPRTERTPDAPALDLPPSFYSSTVIRGTVIDSETDAPVDRAVVAAIWRKVDEHSGRWSGVFVSREVTTDSSGAFTVSPWGPRPAPHDAVLDKRDPELWVIKNGYVVGYFDNAGRAECLLPAGPDVSPAWLKLPPNKMPNVRGRDYERPA